MTAVFTPLAPIGGNNSPQQNRKRAAAIAAGTSRIAGTIVGAGNSRHWGVEESSTTASPTGEAVVL